jgi:hypothetical protein
MPMTTDGYHERTHDPLTGWSLSKVDRVSNDHMSGVNTMAINGHTVHLSINGSGMCRPVITKVERIGSNGWFMYFNSPDEPCVMNYRSYEYVLRYHDQLPSNTKIVVKLNDKTIDMGVDPDTIVITT